MIDKLIPNVVRYSSRESNDFAELYHSEKIKLVWVMLVLGHAVDMTSIT